MADLTPTAGGTSSGLPPKVTPVASRLPDLPAAPVEPAVAGQPFQTLASYGTPLTPDFLMRPLAEQVVTEEAPNPDEGPLGRLNSTGVYSRTKERGKPNPFIAALVDLGSSIDWNNPEMPSPAVRKRYLTGADYVTTNS